MYTVNKRPSKLVAKTRGGLNTFKSIDLTSASTDSLGTDRLTAPRPVFQPIRKTTHHPHHIRDLDEQKPVTPQHVELVKFVQESWTSLAADDDDTAPTQNGHSSTATKNNPPKAIYYVESPSDTLKDFGAFDLESWWGRRLFNSITKSL